MVVEHGGRGRPKSPDVPGLSEQLDVIASLGLTVEKWEALPESEQRWWLARHRRKQARHTCGHPQEVCSDPERTWYPQLEVCYPEREQRAAQDRFKALHEKAPWHDGTFEDWSKVQDAAHPYHFSHGLNIWPAPVDLGLGGDFTRWDEELDEAQDDGGSDSSTS